jgi:ABC-type Fe2+-enterobactin transport system substrate-binding protein
MDEQTKHAYIERLLLILQYEAAHYLAAVRANATHQHLVRSVGPTLRHIPHRRNANTKQTKVHKRDEAASTDRKQREELKQRA